MAVLMSGGDSGERMEGLLGNCGHRILVVPVKNPIRTNLTITDRHGLTVNLNEAGPQLSKVEIARFERVVRTTLDRLEDPGGSWLMICGSVPPGVPATFYAKLVEMARQHKVRTLLHAGGEALRHGIEAGPTVVTPTSRRRSGCWAAPC